MSCRARVVVLREFEAGCALIPIVCGRIGPIPATAVEHGRVSGSTNITFGVFDERRSSNIRLTVTLIRPTPRTRSRPGTRINIPRRPPPRGFSISPSCIIRVPRTHSVNKIGWVGTPALLGTSISFLAEVGLPTCGAVGWEGVRLRSTVSWHYCYKMERVFGSLTSRLMRMQNDEEGGVREMGG